MLPILGARPNWDLRLRLTWELGGTLLDAVVLCCVLALDEVPYKFR